MADTASECLASLYAACEDSSDRGILDGLVEGAGYGWRCWARLPADDDQLCEYLNVPQLHGKPEDAPCANCGSARPARG